MAIIQGARAKSLAFTAVGSGVTGPIANIQNYTFSQPAELAEFLLGTSRVNSHYKSTKSGSIQVETADLVKFTGFVVGQKYTDVILTLEGAIDSAGTAVGDDITITLSHAVVTEVGDLSMSNENSAPVTGSVTFVLSRFGDATADPTIVIA